MRSRKEFFFVKLSAPARRALQCAGIDSAEKLSGYTEQDILSLHSIGKTAIPTLKTVLRDNGLDFKKD